MEVCFSCAHFQFFHKNMQTLAWLDETKYCNLSNDLFFVTGWGSKGHAPLQAVIFVEELSDILAESLPDLWKLGNEYLSGSLFHKVCNFYYKSCYVHR